ncbi:tyrosine-type recombinase/integrase [Corynebacterium glyciniphilum]|uniref:tyrosine-type recombinase/integrase n=1 Tax=Corynebacterium glyciniphilum TaxID=1404244 RepID=UPI003FCFCDE8
MPTPQKYKSAKGIRWRIQYVDPAGTRRTKTGFKTAGAANHWAAENLIQRNTGSWIEPAKQRTTVATIHEQWKSVLNNRKDSYRRQNRVNWTLHVEPRWGTVAVGDITKNEVQRWINDQTHAASTVRQWHAQLSAILDWAVSGGHILVNPARGVILPKKATPKHTYLTPEQVEAFVGECRSRPELARLLATTGLRWGEAVALRPRDIDESKKRIRVSRAVVTVDGVPQMEPELKTWQSRVVTAPSSTFRALRAVTDGKPPQALVWAAKDGGMMKNVSSHGSWFSGAVERCMASDESFPRITPHGLRHVAAGLLVGANADVKVVQRQLGHESASMTLDRYSDLFDGNLDVVADALDALFP